MIQLLFNNRVQFLWLRFYSKAFVGHELRSVFILKCADEEYLVMEEFGNTF